MPILNTEIHFRTRVAIKDELERIAKFKGITLSEYMNNLCKRHLARMNRKKKDKK